MSAQTNKQRSTGNKPQKARASSKKTSQSARILEHLELLISLQENQENGGNVELSRLISELETWKKQSQSLLAETNSLVSESEIHSKELLAEQLDSTATGIVETLESKLLDRFESLDQRVSEIATTVRHWSESAACSDSDKTNLDVSELLTLQGQELEARFELFTEHFDTKTNQVLELVTDSSGQGDSDNETPELVNRLEEIGQNISLITEFVETQQDLSVAIRSPQGLLSDQLDRPANDLSENIDLLADHFDVKTEKLCSALQAQFQEQLEQRFEDLNAHVNKITTVLEGQQALLESVKAQEIDPGALALDLLDKRIEVIANSFNSRIDDIFGSLGTRISQLSENLARHESKAETEELIEKTEEDTASHWHRQKTAMLSKYGIDPDYRPLEDPQENTSQVEQPESDLEDVAEELESLHDSIDNISAADAEAIDNLKEELTSKLRDAEVEFSINRAKLSQLKAELDSRQVELERRAASLEEKYGGTPSVEKSGFLDRLARHLSLRKTE